MRITICMMVVSDKSKLRVTVDHDRKLKSRKGSYFYIASCRLDLEYHSVMQLIRLPSKQGTLGVLYYIGVEMQPGCPNQRTQFITRMNDRNHR